MESLGLDAAFVHTADNVFYLSGVPLLSEWGRPLWLVVGHHNLHVICAPIETENARSFGYQADVHPYDDHPAIEQATRLVAPLLQSTVADRGVTGIERQRLPRREEGHRGSGWALVGTPFGERRAQQERR